MNLFAKPVNFLKEVKAQLIKVSWPTRQELIGASLVVIVFTFLSAVFIGSVDVMLSNLLSWIFR